MRHALVPAALTGLLLGAAPVHAGGPRETAAPTAPAPRQGKLARTLERWMSRLHLPPKLQAAIDKRVCLVRGKCTLLADRIEAKLPPRLSRGFHKLRDVSPLAMSSFAAHEFKKDRVFLATAGTATVLGVHLEVPVLLALGVNPVVTGVVHEVTEPLFLLGLVAWRQHHLRKGSTFVGTLKHLGREYKQYVRGRREENRAFMRERAAKQSTLRALGAGLTEAGERR